MPHRAHRALDELAHCLCLGAASDDLPDMTGRECVERFIDAVARGDTPEL
jgi:hypothetical protein